LKFGEVYDVSPKNSSILRNLFDVLNVHAAEALATAGSVAAATLSQNAGKVGGRVIADSLLSQIETLKKHRVNLELMKPV
jgi:acyl-CoA thioesterase